MTINYCNRAVFRLFGLPEEDLQFHPASDLFDPLPENRTLWQIIWERRQAEERLLTVRIRGKTYE